MLKGKIYEKYSRFICDINAKNKTALCIKCTYINPFRELNTHLQHCIYLFFWIYFVILKYNIYR